MHETKKYHDLNVIVGLGKTGLSCVRYLAKKGANIVVTDSRQDPPGLAELHQQFPQIPFSGNGFNEEWLQAASQIILSPGISLQEPAIAAAVQRGIPVIGDIELFARAVTKPVIGITGSNGKTTVTTLMGLVIAAAGYRVAVGGNIGCPALDLLDPDDTEAEADYYVLELSSFQLETTSSLQLATAVLLNLSADHMDRYATIQNYLQAKCRIFMHCLHPILNAEERELWADNKLIKNPVTFGLADQADSDGDFEADCNADSNVGSNADSDDCNADFRLGQFAGQDYLMHQSQPLLALSDLPLQQRHHLQNVLAVLAMGTSLGLPLEAMTIVIKQFKGLPHRCQLVSESGGVRWYNDSKGTNVGATLAAIFSLGQGKPGRLLLIAGGISKQADLTPLREPVKQYVDQVILLGQDGPLFFDQLHQLVPCMEVATMADAVATARKLAKPNDIVLLSPACASFDMFDNYEHRGNVFMDLVLNK